MSSWKRTEREIAKVLTKQLSEVGKGFEITRIPILGREGPDLTYPNPFHLVIDVKDRGECPKGLFKIVDQDPSLYYHIRYDETIQLRWFVCRLDHWIDIVQDPTSHFSWFHSIAHYPHSTTINRWLDHICAWEGRKAGDAGALILHRPRMRYAHSVVLFHSHHLPLLIARWRAEGLQSDYSPQYLPVSEKRKEAA